MNPIRVELQLSDGSFSSGLLRAGQSLASFKKELERVDPNFRKVINTSGEFVKSAGRVDVVSKGLLGTMRDLSIVGGAVGMAFSSLTGASGGFIGQIVKVNSDMERLRFQMEGMSRSSDPIKEAGDNVAYLREQAKSMPFSLKEISTSFVKLKATGTDPMAGSLQSIADGIAAFGGTDEQLHRVTLGISQMSGKSVIQMEEMRQQLGESMPNAMQVMARSMGVSVAELTKAISTGRVQSEPALKAFYAELERTYGGEALRMMQTFSGQVTQMNANLQQLATGPGLSGFVNDTLKTIITEFNTFLQGAEAKKFADELGYSMASLANRIATAGRVLYEFRDGIVTMAKWGTYGLIVKGLASAVSYLGLAFRSTVLQLTSANIALGAARYNFDLMTLSVMTSGGAAFTASSAFKALGFAAVAAGRAFMTFAPYILILGSAIAMAGDQFGWFGDKVADAYKELKNYGAESRALAAQISKDKEASLREQLRVLEVQNRGFRQHGNSELKAKMDAVTAELEAVLAEREDLISKSGERERAESLQNYERQISDGQRQAQSDYKMRVVELEKWLTTEQASRATSGKSEKEISDKYREDLLDAQKKYAQTRVDMLQAEINKQESIVKSSTANSYAETSAKDMLDFVRGAFISANEELKALDAGIAGINLGPVLESQTAKVTKATDTVAGLNEEIAGLKAKIVGSSGAYATMMMKIANGDYGSVKEGGEEVAKLHEELLAATTQKEALDRIMKGQDKVETDIERARINALEKQMELKEKLADTKMTESEKIQFKLDNGYYDGLGPIDNIREAIVGVVGVIDLQGQAANQVADVMQKNAFGDPTVTKIDSVTSAISRLSDGILGLNGNLSGVNFDAFNSMMGSTRDFSGFAGGMLDLIGKSEGTDKGRGYNETLDYGKWTGGDRNLVTMTLDDILKLGDSMRTPENRAQYAGGGSSALGRYQIVGDTMRGLMKEMGLTGGELFSPEMQDAMASRLLSRRGNDPTGLGQEWTSLKNVDPAVIAAAWNRGAVGPTRDNAAAATATTYTPPGPRAEAAPRYDAVATQKQMALLEEQRVAKTKELGVEIKKVGAIEDENLTAEEQVARQDYLNDMIEKTKALGIDVEDLGTNYKSLAAAIASGKMGTSTSVDAPEYADMVKAAHELDALEKDIATKKKASKDIDAEKVKLDADRVELATRLADEQERAKNPDYVATSTELRQLNKDMDELIANTSILYGTDSTQYKDAIAEKAKAVAEFSMLEVETRRADMEGERRDTENSLLSERQQRKIEFERQNAMVDDQAAKMRAAGYAEIEVTRFVEEQKAAIRAAYAQQTNPITAQMQDWKDLQGNLFDKTTQWTENAAEGLTSLALGTGDLSSAINGMLHDVVNDGIKYMMSNLMGGGGDGGKLSGGMSKLAGGAGGGGGKLAGIGKIAGVKHTGGIVGGSGVTRRVSPGLFANAPKFHTGGIVGAKLQGGEIPIIAKRKEGVFTEAQMAALAPVGNSGGHVFQISAPVTVSGSSGSHEQNADLAKQMAREMDATMRGVMRDEIIKQMRPGAMLNKGRN